MRQYDIGRVVGSVGGAREREPIGIGGYDRWKVDSRVAGGGRRHGTKEDPEHWCTRCVEVKNFFARAEWDNGWTERGGE